MFQKALFKHIPLRLINKTTSLAMANPWTYKALVSSTKPGTLEQIGRRRLMAMFHKAAERVPHYKRHLQRLGVDHTKIRRPEELLAIVEDIAISKENYKHTAPSPRDLCIDGNSYPAQSLMTSSSGYSSGSPTFWVRGKEELAAQAADVNLGLSLLVRADKVPTAHLNLFRPGPWVSSPTANRILGRSGTFIPGDSLTPSGAITLIRETLACEAPAFQQMIVYGYPPYLEEMIDVGERMGFDWSSHLIHITCAGQTLSESERSYMKSRLHPDAWIISNLGSSDISASMAFEDPFTIRLRQEILNDPTLRRALAIDPTARELTLEPSIFAYNCTCYHVVERGSKLYWSTIIPGAVEPLIMYDLGDTGFVMSQEVLRERLAQYYNGWQNVRDHFGEAIEFLDIMPLPIVGVYGRYDGTVDLVGKLISPNIVKDAIIDCGLWGRTSHFTLEELVIGGVSKGIRVNVGVSEGVLLTDELRQSYLDGVVSYLRRTIEGYQEAVASLPGAGAIHVELYPIGKLEEGAIKLRHIKKQEIQGSSDSGELP